MNTVKRNVLIGTGALACVLAGAGIERARHALFSDPPETIETETLVAARPAEKIVTVRDETAEREAAALRRRIAELERAIASAAQTEDKTAATEPQEEEPPRNRRDRRGGDRMERLREENPEAFAEMQRRREEFRAEMEQRARDRTDFVASLDTRNMNATQRENHERLLEAIAYADELRAAMDDPNAERTPEMRREMGETMATISALYEEERRYLFEEAARSVGYKNDDASAFADHIQTIIDNTSMMPFGGGRGGPGGPGGRR